MTNLGWQGFKDGVWKDTINVEDFIRNNYTEYKGDESFLCDRSEKTDAVYKITRELILEEIKKGIIDVETEKVSGIDNFDPGYIDKDNEVIVGLQTDKPLKRIVNPYGGMRMDINLIKTLRTISKNIERHIMTAYLTPIPQK